MQSCGASIAETMQYVPCEAKSPGSVGRSGVTALVSPDYLGLAEDNLNIIFIGVEVPMRCLLFFVCQRCVGLVRQNKNAVLKVYLWLCLLKPYRQTVGYPKQLCCNDDLFSFHFSACLSIPY